MMEPPRPTGRHYRAADLPVRRRGGVVVRDLLPEKLPCAEIGRIEIPPGATMVGVPHTSGTRATWWSSRATSVIRTGTPAAPAPWGYSVVLLAPPVA